MTSIQLDGQTLPGEDNLVPAEGLLALLAGLVDQEEVHGKTFLKLAHFSVREYLVSDDIRQGPASAFALQSDTSHSVLARQCLSYILQCCHDFSQQCGQVSSSNYQMMKYCSQYWTGHYWEIGKKSNTEADKQFLNVLMDDARLQEMLKLYRPDTHLSWKRDEFPVGSPLYYATSLGLTSCVEQLIDKGYDLNATGGRFHTPLQAASRLQSIQMVERLLDAGADPTIYGGQYVTPLGAAASWGSEPHVAVLLRNGGSVSASEGIAIYWAIMEGHIAVVRMFIDAGVDVENVNERFGTPLIAAARWGQPSIVDLLLDSGARVNAEATVSGRKFVTALQSAAWCQMEEAVEVVELLVRRGAKVDDVRGEYGTALMTACEACNEDTAIALLKLGADPTLRSRSGESPLDLAVRKGLTGLSTKMREFRANQVTNAGHGMTLTYGRSAMEGYI